MKTGFYCADEINGVYFFGKSLDEPEIDVFTPRMFYDALLYTQEPIYTFLDVEHEEIYDLIVEEYGIR